MAKAKKILSGVCFLFSITILHAQQGTVSAGGDASGAGGSASYSIGQVDHITVTGSGGTITQGLQQSYEIYVITGIEATDIDLFLSVYPNPTAELLTLSVKGLSTSNMDYILSDEQGRLIKQDKLSGPETSVSLIELRKAIYFVRIIDNKKELKVFKIIKN